MQFIKTNIIEIQYRGSFNSMEACENELYALPNTNISGVSYTKVKLEKSEKLKNNEKLVEF